MHEPNINKAAEAAFAAGVGTTGYAPTALVKRDQMASFLTRMFVAATAGN